jgi:hypothetical protein
VHGAVKGYQSVHTDERTYLSAVFGSDTGIADNFPCTKAISQTGILFGFHQNSLMTVADREWLAGLFTDDPEATTGAAASDAADVPEPTTMNMGSFTSLGDAARAAATKRQRTADMEKLQQLGQGRKQPPLRTLARFHEFGCATHVLLDDLRLLDVVEHCGTRFALDLALLVCIQFWAHVNGRFMVPRATPEGDTSPALPPELIAMDRSEWEIHDLSALSAEIAADQGDAWGTLDENKEIILPTPLAHLATSHTLLEFFYRVLGRLLGPKDARMLLETTGLRLNANWVNFMGFMVNPYESELLVLENVMKNNPGVFVGTQVRLSLSLSLPLPGDSRALLLMAVRGLLLADTTAHQLCAAPSRVVSLHAPGGQAWTRTSPVSLLPHRAFPPGARVHDGSQLVVRRQGQALANHPCSLHKAGECTDTRCVLGCSSWISPTSSSRCYPTTAVWLLCAPQLGRSASSRRCTTLTTARSP